MIWVNNIKDIKKEGKYKDTVRNHKRGACAARRQLGSNYTLFSQNNFCLLHRYNPENTIHTQ